MVSPNFSHLVVLGRQLVGFEWMLFGIAWCKPTFRVIGASTVCNYGLNCAWGVCGGRGEGHPMWTMTCLSYSYQRVVSGVWVKEFEPPSSIVWFVKNLTHLVVLECEFVGSVWLSFGIVWCKSDLGVTGAHTLCLYGLKCACGGCCRGDASYSEWLAASLS